MLLYHIAGGLFFELLDIVPLSEPLALAPLQNFNACGVPNASPTASQCPKKKAAKAATSAQEAPYGEARAVQLRGMSRRTACTLVLVIAAAASQLLEIEKEALPVVPNSKMYAAQVSDARADYAAR